MTPRTFSTRAAALLAAAVCCANCENGSFMLPPPPAGDRLASDLAVSEAEIDPLVAALNGGMDVNAAMQGAVAALSSHPSVLAVGVDEDGAQLYVYYKSGLEHVTAVVDGEGGVGGPAPSGRRTGAEAPVMGAKRQTTAQAAAPVAPINLDEVNRFPSTGKALVASSLPPCLSCYDYARPEIKAMLEEIGYQVDSKPADIEAFTRLHEYSVIYLEAVGRTRRMSEFNADLVRRHTAQRNTDGTQSHCDPYSILEGNEYLLETATPWSAETAKQYAADIHCGRVKAFTTVLAARDAKGRRSYQRCRTSLAVTPNFLRAAHRGAFPRDMLICIGVAGSVRRPDPTAAFTDWPTVFHELSGNAHVIGWQGPSHPSWSALAFMNLFQVMTGSSRRFTAPCGDHAGIQESLDLPPPWDVQNVFESFAVLDDPAFPHRTLDTGTGARMAYVPGGAASGPLALAPSVHGFQIEKTGRALLRGWLQDNATLRLDDGSNVTNLSVGAHGADGRPGWTVRVPGGAGGRISVHLPDGRHSRPRELLTWNIRLEMTGTGPHGMTFTAKLALLARALPVTRSQSGAFGTNLFNWRPLDQFSTEVLEGGSVANWSVSGGAIEGGTEYHYSGSGAQPLTFVEGRAGFSGGSATGAELYADVTTQLTYTETITSRDPNGAPIVTTTQGQLPGIPPLTFTLNPDWTLAAGSKPLEGGWNVTVRWNDVPPTPLYDRDRLRR